MSSLARSGVLGVLLASALMLGPLPPTAAAVPQGHQGLQGGWAIDDSGHLNFPHSVRSELPYMAQAGAGVLRVNFRLGACFVDWTSAGCTGADGGNALAVYDTLVNEATSTYGLKVVGLISNEAWPGDQTQWTANNAELNVSGTGDNIYIQNFANKAAGVLASHFVGRVSTWEVWNEPNAYHDTGPGAGEFSGGSFIYPSNFAWVLKRSYAAIKAAQPGATSTVISGGLFGSDIGGAAVALVRPNGARETVTKNSAPGAPVTGAGASCTSSVPSGADYLCNTYRMGQSKAAWRAGAYPLDVVGQHLYVDQNGVTSSAKLTSYLQDVRNAYLAFEGKGTAKKTEITEFGWVANPEAAAYVKQAGNQAANIQTAYSTFRKTTYVLRADYFVAQDVPEGNVFYGLVQGDGTTLKPAFTAYQSYATY